MKKLFIFLFSVFFINLSMPMGTISDDPQEKTDSLININQQKSTDYPKKNSDYECCSEINPEYINNRSYALRESSL